jgi:hypothetical protein
MSRKQEPCFARLRTAAIAAEYRQRRREQRDTGTEAVHA